MGCSPRFYTETVTTEWSDYNVALTDMTTSLTPFLRNTEDRARNALQLACAFGYAFYQIYAMSMPNAHSTLMRARESW